MIPETRVERRAVADLTPADYNPRQISDRAMAGLRESVTRFGLVQPIIINQRTGNVVGGHQRLKVLGAEGVEDTDVVVVDIEAKEERALNVALNNPHISGDFTDELDSMLEGIASDTPELFDALRLDDLLDELAGGGPDVSDAASAASARFTDEQVIDAAFAWFRSNGFPYRNVARHVAMQTINKLAAAEAEDLRNSQLGHHVADTYHPHRFHSAAEGMRSPSDAFADDSALRKTMALALTIGAIPQTAPAPLWVVNGTQACANFRPGFASLLYRRFCPPGATVLDTSTGYGGRLVGAIGSGVVAHYIGIDPSTKTHEGNTRILAELSPDGFTGELHNLPAEDVAHETVAGRCDFAFTSPPYFAKEHYSDEDTQSWKRYADGEGWRLGFLVPMLALQFAALKPGSTNIVNIADVKLRGKTWPLVDWTVDAAADAGFEFIRREDFPMTSRFGAGHSDEVATEPVLIFRRPGYAEG